MTVIFFLGPIPFLHATPLNDGTPAEKISYIESMVETKKLTKGLISTLANIVSDTHSPLLVKERAAWAMGQLYLRKKAAHLVKGAQNKSLIVRSAALGALMHMRARSGLATYIHIAKNDPILSLRQKATLALGLLRWDKAIKPLVDLSSDQRVEIRGASALAMAATHSNKNDFRELLKEMTQDKSLYVVKRAKKGLNVANRSHQKIRTHLQSTDPDIRLFAAFFFHHHGKASDRTALQTRLNKEKNTEVHYEINQALQGIKKRIAKEKARKERLRKQAARKEAARKKALAEKAKTQQSTQQ